MRGVAEEGHSAARPRRKPNEFEVVPADPDVGRGAQQRFQIGEAAHPRVDVEMVAAGGGVVGIGDQGEVDMFGGARGVQQPAPAVEMLEMFHAVRGRKVAGGGGHHEPGRALTHLDAPGGETEPVAQPRMHPIGDDDQIGVGDAAVLELHPPVRFGDHGGGIGDELDPGTGGRLHQRIDQPVPQQRVATRAALGVDIDAVQGASGARSSFDGRADMRAAGSVGEGADLFQRG